MKPITTAFTVAFALLAASPVLAQRQTFTLDAKASDVKITLKTTHELVNGTFHIDSGSIDYDPNGSSMSGTVVVAAGSGKTGNDSRDKRMNKEILKVQQYSTVSFTAKSFSGTLAPSGDSTIQVAGIFTLLGTPHDITVPMQVHIEGAGCRAKSHFIVPYVQWGLKNPSFLIWKADNDVAIDLDLAGQLSH